MKVTFHPDFSFRRRKENLPVADFLSRVGKKSCRLAKLSFHPNFPHSSSMALNPSGTVGEQKVSHTALWIVGGISMIAALALLGVVIWLVVKKRHTPAPSPPGPPTPPGPPGPPTPPSFPQIGATNLTWRLSGVSSGSETFSPQGEETDEQILFSSETSKKKYRRSSC